MKNNEEKKNRLSILGKIHPLARQDHRHFLNENGKHRLLQALPRNERRLLAKQSKVFAEQYRQILRSISNSGAGFPIDQLIRQLAIEYTHRYASSGTNNQPISFNYFEPFCEIKLIDKSVAPYAVPINEMDHLFSVGDFFDYLTSSDSKNFKLNSLMNLPEDTAFHFTANGDLSDFTYLNSDGREFLISGFSMVRRGSFLHWCVIGGELLDEAEWEARSNSQIEISLDSVPPFKRAFMEDSLRLNSNKSGSPVALEGASTAIRTIYAGETDLKSEKHLSRCYMSEMENAFFMICDDPEIFDDIPNIKDREESIANMLDRMKKAAVMWELAEAMFHLPAYFAFKVGISKKVLFSSGVSITQDRLNGARGVNAKYRAVSAIEVRSTDEPAIRALIPQHFEVETAGHWRKLADGSQGTGPHGEVTEGRTWIKRESKWRARQEEQRTIYIKSLVSTAKLKAAEIEAATLAVEGRKKITTTKGVIYALRCMAMKDEIYKVGWTSGDAQERADQLSAATGVPISFVVVDSWQHTDAEKLEKDIHAMLAPYRIAPNREFFHVSYEVLSKVVKDTLAKNSQ